MNRTPDLLITNELLYRLSYTGWNGADYSPQAQSARARLTTSRTSLLKSVLAATRAIASRAALRYGSASFFQRSSARARRAATYGLKLSSSITRSLQNT